MISVGFSGSLTGDVLPSNGKRGVGFATRSRSLVESDEAVTFALSLCSGIDRVFMVL